MSSRAFNQDCYVDGRWVAAGDGNRTAVTDPATGDEVGSVPSLAPGEVDAAIEAAEAAWPAWRDTTAAERAGLLRAWSAAIVEHGDDLARLMTREQGKPVAEAAGEMTYAVSFIDWFAEEARRTYGTVVPPHVAGGRVWTTKQPVGVCSLITPWNFPAAMITRKAAPALAAGCTVVIKPAPATPLTALALAELADDVGIPAGVVNVVTGDAEQIGPRLTGHPAVRKLSFTGSTAVGRILLGQAATGVLRTSMELGGNAPLIVFDDADLDVAVAGTMAAKFRNAGQTCISPNRIFVHADVHDAYAERLVAAVEDQVVGNGLDEGVTIGPLIDEAGLAKVEAHVADAVARGATVLTGGTPHELGGTFFTPTVLTGVVSEAECSCAETFGPVAALATFTDEAAVVAEANATPYGLASYLFTTDLNRAHRVADALEAGLVGVNAGAISTATAPFGGYKQSGIGREGAHDGIEEYLETKYVCLGDVGG